MRATIRKKQITEIVEEFRPKIEPIKLKYKEKQSQFLSAMVTGKSSEEIMAKQEEINQLYGQIVSNYMVMHLKVRKLLTAEQIPRYEAYRTQQGWDKAAGAGRGAAGGANGAVGGGSAIKGKSGGQ